MVDFLYFNLPFNLLYLLICFILYSFNLYPLSTVQYNKTDMNLLKVATGEKRVKAIRLKIKIKN
jgi:hypothetical protein